MKETMDLNQAKKSDILKLEGCLKKLILRHNPNIMKNIIRISKEKKILNN